MTLVSQSFGNENEYRRAIFAIWSYWVHYQIDGKVILFTDQPDFFYPFLTDRVQYILLTREKIKEMRGEIDFLHRIKIALIEEAFRISNSSIIYIDSDTFFTSDPTAKINELTQHVSLMHLKEYPFYQMKNAPLPGGETAQAFYNLIKKNEFKLAKGKNLKVDEKLFSWNAGVMFLHSSVASLLPDVFKLTDQFYPPTQNHASEQFAFSIVLQTNLHLDECSNVVYHYWYRVKKKVMDHLLEHEIFSSWKLLSQSERQDRINCWTNALPQVFESHAWTIRDNAIQAFNENCFSDGWLWAFKALLMEPLDIAFIKDALYHTRRIILKSIRREK